MIAACASVRDVLEGRTIAELARRLSTEQRAARYAERAPHYMGAEEADEEATLSMPRPPVQYEPLPARSAHGQASLGDPLVPLQPHGSRPPVFLVHPTGGLCMPYAVLLAHLDPELPVHGLNDPQFGAAERPIDNVGGLAALPGGGRHAPSRRRSGARDSGADRHRARRHPAAPRHDVTRLSALSW
jgi:hypothetical protein